MTKLQKLKAEVSTLNRRQKSDLVDYLVQSELTDFHPSVKDAWLKELRKRAAEVESGEAKLVSHDTVMARLRKRLR